MSVIVVFPGHTYLFFLDYMFTQMLKIASKLTSTTISSRENPLIRAALERSAVNC